MEYNNYYPVQPGHPPPGPPPGPPMPMQQQPQHQQQQPQMMQPGNHPNNMMHHSPMPPQNMRQNLTPGPQPGAPMPPHLGGPPPHQHQMQHQIPPPPPPQMQQPHPHMQPGGPPGPMGGPGGSQQHMTNHYHQLPPHPPLPHSASPHHPSPHHTPNHLLQQPPRPSTGPSPLQQPPMQQSPHSNHINGPPQMHAPQQPPTPGSHGPTPPQQLNQMVPGGPHPSLNPMGPPPGTVGMPPQHQNMNNQNFVGAPNHMGPHLSNVPQPPPPHYLPPNQLPPPNHAPPPHIGPIHHGGHQPASSYLPHVQPMERVSPLYHHHIPRTEFRLIELNRRLQNRPRPRGPPSPLPLIGSMEESDWWERFACDFFDDESILTLRISVDDKPTDYTIGRTLIPRFFRSYFDGGVIDLQIKSRNFREITHHNLTTLECDQADIITKNVFKPSTNPNLIMNAVIHTEGHLSLDFVSNSFDNLLIKSWRFYTHQCHEYVDRSVTAGYPNTFLVEPVTKMGLTKSTISYLKMCMIMEPMQDLMLQHRQTKMDPRMCLKQLLFDKYKLKNVDDNRAPITKRRKRKATTTAGGATGGATKRGKANANTANALNNNNIGFNNMNNNASLMSPSTVGSVPNLSLASQDVMVVGEPSMLGADFGDENERRITRLENNQFDASTVPDNNGNPLNNNSSMNQNQPCSNSNNNNDSTSVSTNSPIQPNSNLSHMQQNNLDTGGSNMQMLNSSSNNIHGSSDPNISNTSSNSNNCVPNNSINNNTNSTNNNNNESSNNNHQMNLMNGSMNHMNHIPKSEPPSETPTTDQETR